MGQLVMSFRGLCIHVTKAPFLPDGVQHRVVAIDANDGFQRQDLDLPAHHCYLEVSSDISAALLGAGLSFDPNLGSGGGVPFNGYRLTVVNAIASQGLHVDLDAASTSVTDTALTTVPSLTKFSPMELLPSITTETGAPSWADCYVDINLGTITTGSFPITPPPIVGGGGLYTTWTVQTDGDPILQLIGRDGRTLIVEGTEGTSLSTPPGLTLSDDVPGSLVLHNSTTDLTDKPFDFALYYLAGTGGIPDPLPLNLPGEKPQLGRVDTTPSCSNSRYP